MEIRDSKQVYVNVYVYICRFPNWTILVLAGREQLVEAAEVE